MNFMIYETKLAKGVRFRFELQMQGMIDKSNKRCVPI